MSNNVSKQTDVLKNNLPANVQFREQVLEAERGVVAAIEAGEVESVIDQCVVTHHFSPIDETYGCCTYAREMFIPKGTLIVGKIHRHQHLNFIQQGKVSVATEFGVKYLEAPCTFVSEVGLKRVVIAEEDTIWVTVHLTKYNNEEDLNKIEDEVIAPTYEELGMIDSTNKLGETL